MGGLHEGTTKDYEALSPCNWNPILTCVTILRSLLNVGGDNLFIALKAVEDTCQTMPGYI